MRNLVMVIGLNGVMGCSRHFTHHTNPGQPLTVLPAIHNDARIFQQFIMRSNSLDDSHTAHYLRGRFTSWALRKFFDNLWGERTHSGTLNNIAVVSENGVDDYLVSMKGRPEPYTIVSQQQIDDCIDDVLTREDKRTTYWHFGGVTSIKKLIGQALGKKLKLDNLVVIQLQQDMEGDLGMDIDGLIAMLDSNFTLHSELQNQNVKIMRFQPVSAAK